MTLTEPSIEYYGVYQPLFRLHVHQLLQWGYQDALHRIRQATQLEQQEPAITGFITASIKNRKRSRNRPLWVKNFSVYDDPTVEAEGKSGRSRPRVDIIIEANWDGCPEYHFEAKRLRANGYEPNKYLGNEGVGCFINGVYARRYDEAAMLGYVQSDSLADWQLKLKEKIQQSAIDLQLCSPPTDVTFPHSFPLEWQTEHLRPSIGRSITICHILLDCIPTTTY